MAIIILPQDEAHQSHGNVEPKKKFLLNESTQLATRQNCCLCKLDNSEIKNLPGSHDLTTPNTRHRPAAFFPRLRKVCFLWPRFCCWPPRSPVWQSNLDLSRGKKWAKPVKTFELSDVESWLNPPNEAHLTKVHHKKSTATLQGTAR